MQKTLKSYRQILSEMSFTRNKVEEIVTGRGGPILRHLIKIIKYDDPRNYKKHVHDINNWLNDISDLKIKGGKKPSSFDLYTWLVPDNRFSVNMVDQFDYSAYADLPKNNISNDQIYRYCDAIMLNVVIDIANRKFVSIEKYLE